MFQREKNTKNYASWRTFTALHSTLSPPPPFFIVTVINSKKLNFYTNFIPELQNGWKKPTVNWGLFLSVDARLRNLFLLFFLSQKEASLRKTKNKTKQITNSIPKPIKKNKTENKSNCFKFRSLISTLNYRIEKYSSKWFAIWFKQ